MPAKLGKKKKKVEKKVVAKRVGAKPKNAAAKPKKFSWKAFEKQVDKLKPLVDDDKYAEAVAAFAPLVATLPPAGENEYEPARGNALNLYGIALAHVKQFAKARTIFGHAIEALSDDARLNLIDMLLDEDRDYTAVIAEVGKARDAGGLDGYHRAWLARYVAVAYLETGDVAKAEAELREVVVDFAIDKPELVTSVREGIEKYVEPGTRPNTDAARGFLGWLAPKSYDTSPEANAANKTWWKALPKKVREKLLEEIRVEQESELAIARARDATSLDLDEDDGKVTDLAPFLTCPSLERLSFYGEPESIEPLRALPKLDRLTINNNVIKNFKWPTQAERDLIAAAKKRNKAGMEAALAAGASIMTRDEDGDTALHHVAGEHDLKLSLWLIERGADPWAGCHGESSAMYFFGDEDKAKLAAAAVKAGLRHADDDPYRELSVTHHNKGATFEHPDIDDCRFDDGDKLAGKWPATVKLKMAPPKKDNKLHPMLRCGYRSALVNEALAEIVRGDGVELLPVTLVDHAGKARPEKYYFLNPLECDCIDPERAHPQWNHIDPDSASEIAAFAIDERKVGARALFRPGLLNGRPMIVTKALAEKLAGFEGVSIDFLKR